MVDKAAWERNWQIEKEFRKRFPQAFTKKPQPLKLGIEHDLIAAMPDVPAEDVKAALVWVITGESSIGAYLECLIEGRPRVDLEGKAAGRVTAAEHAEAVRLLSEHFTNF
jgi:sRNA-binding protein